MKAQHSWVVRRVADGRYFNGFKREPWSLSIVSALVFSSKSAAQETVAEKGFRLAAVVFERLPHIVRSVKVRRLRLVS